MKVFCLAHRNMNTLTQILMTVLKYIPPYGYDSYYD